MCVYTAHTHTHRHLWHWEAKQMFLTGFNWSEQTQTLMRDCCLTLFQVKRIFRLSRAWPLTPTIISSQQNVFFCPCFSLHRPRRSFFFFFKLRTSEWRMGVPSVYPPLPPANLQPAQGGFCALLEEVYCVPICPPSPPSFSASATVWPEKTHGRCGGAAAPAERRRRRGGFGLLRTRQCACVRKTDSNLCLWRDAGYI